MNNLPQVIIYTDGACDPNPGPGGWAAILRSGAHERVLTGSAPDTTNNRMELTAAIEALKTLKVPSRITFYTDSQYLRRGITEWIPRWKARNWRRKGGKLANIDLWQQLDASIQSHQIQWEWVRGHAGNPLNQKADRLARAAILNRAQNSMDDRQGLL
jgi:ribonuclease HI